MKNRSFAVALVVVAATAACTRPTPVEEGAPATEAEAASSPASSPAELPPPAGEGATVVECPDSDTRPTVILRGCDTGVRNVAVGDCTLADQLRECETGPAEDFPRCVAKTTERLVERGVIGGPQKGALQICAADDREREGERPAQ